MRQQICYNELKNAQICHLDIMYHVPNIGNGRAKSQVGRQRMVFVGWSSSQPGQAVSTRNREVDISAEISLFCPFAFFCIFFLFAFQGIMRLWLSVLGRIAKRLGHGCSLTDLIGAAGESTAAEDLLLTVGATLARTARRGGSRLQAVFPRAFPGSFHHVSNQ